MLERFYQGVCEYGNNIQKGRTEFWVGYTGTMGASYDLKTIISAIARLNSIGYRNIKFIIMGQGPEQEYLEKYIKEMHIPNVKFLGFLDYEMMAVYFLNVIWL